MILVFNLQAFGQRFDGAFGGCVGRDPHKTGNTNAGTGKNHSAAVLLCHIGENALAKPQGAEIIYVENILVGIHTRIRFRIESTSACVVNCDIQRLEFGNGGFHCCLNV